MNKILAFSFIVMNLYSGSLHAQFRPELRLGTAVYAEPTLRFAQPVASDNSGNIRLGGLTAAVAIPINAWCMHELGIAELSYQSQQFAYTVQPDSQFANTVVVNGGRQRIFRNRLSYEAIFQYSFRRIRIGLGIAARPYMETARTTPAIGTVLPDQRLVLGFDAGITPRFAVQCAPHIALECGVPISVFDVFIRRQRVLNPVLPEAAQQTWTTETRWLALLGLRLALCVRL